MVEGILAQTIAVDGGPLQTIQVCLSNPTDAAVTLAACMRQIDHLWDYGRDTGSVLAETTLTLPVASSTG